ncbi:MAG: hypothetical protein NXI25_19850 [bacterium]|nr:hypothetical protein [bacterium]
MANAFQVDRYTFRQLHESAALKTEVLSGVQAIFEQLHELRNSGSSGYLHDRVDYEALISANYNHTRDFGYFFILRACGHNTIVGFILAFDDLGPDARPGQPEEGKEVNPVFPLEHIAHHVGHEAPFVKDLFIISRFALLFQIGIDSRYHRSGCGQQLIRAFEATYHKAHLLAGSLHERQYHVFKLLLNMENEDHEYIFLDHYFELDKAEHWFRIVKLLSSKGFNRKVNYKNLPNIYSTVIPIQLSRAVNTVNRIIQHLGARVLWSSFFNASEMLQRRHGLEHDNHGFFNALKEVRNDEDYTFMLERLRDITAYLRYKASQARRVPSLTDSFKNNAAYQVFFLNDAPSNHNFGQFETPVCFDINDEEALLRNFLRHDLIQSRPAYRKLSNTEKEQWHNTLIQVTNARFGSPKKQDEVFQQEAETEWAGWKRKLYIDDAQEQILMDGTRAVLREMAQHPLTPAEQEAKQQYETLSWHIKGLRVVPEQNRQEWANYLKLHNLACQLDQKVLDHPDQYWWCHAMIPINHYGHGNVVGIMFAFRCRKTEGPEGKKCLGNLASLISSSLSKNMLNILIKLQQKATQDASNRYVTAAVTSRNLAHNFGSHILPNLDQPQLLRNLAKWDYTTNFHYEMARFLRFLRTRTSLLADIATSEPVSTSTQWLNNDILRNFRQQSIIKRYLSNDIIKRVDINYLVKGQLKQPDIEVQIPNGDLGASAFYMILENIIRNVVKYEDTAQLPELKISIDVQDDDERGYFIAIYDNSLRKDHEVPALVQNIQRKYIQKSAIDTRNSSISGRGWGIYEMQAAASYLRKKIPGTNLSEKHNRTIPIMQARTIKLPGEELLNRAEQGYPVKVTDEAPHQTTYSLALAYHIYLKKPRTLLLIDLHNKISDEAVLAADNRKDTKLLRKLERLNNPNEIHSHLFAIFFQKEERAELEISKRFPLRWILAESKEDIQKLETLLLGRGNGIKLQKWLWKRWIMAYMTRKNLDPHTVELYVKALDKSDAPSYRVHENPEEICIYDDHGEFAAANPDFPRERLLFYQTHRSTDALGVTFQGRGNMGPDEQMLLKAELLEAAITNIIIVDERIQRDVLQKTYQAGKEDLFLNLQLMNIIVPDPRQKAPNLYGPIDDQALARWLRRILTSQKVDFLVIHLGILEAWVGSDMKKITPWLKKHIAEVDPRTEIVFISGRGKPMGLPREVSFQPYNSISKYTIEGQPSKYHLTKILFSSRTRPIL